MIVLANGTALCWFGKLGGEQFVYLCGLVILGHRAPDLVAAWKGNK